MNDADSYLSDYVFKLKKELYGLKQALRAWYKRLTMFLLGKGYERRRADKILFISHLKSRLIIAQKYVDDIVFRSSPEIKFREFVNLIQNEFEVSAVGKLNYFLHLQVMQIDVGIFISQAKYAKNLVKKFGLEL